MTISLALLAALGTGGKITPSTLINESFATRGYGAMSLSALPTPALELRADEPSIGISVRMKNRWRVHAHRTMPGVLLAEVAPVSDVFDADGFALADARLGGAKLGSPPKPKTLAALMAPDGTLVRVNDLLALYGLSAEELPWPYRYRILRVRIDAKRVADPWPLVSAVVGARVAKDRKTGKATTEFDPRSFRSLVVATLSHGEKVGGDARTRIRYFLGRYGHERISDAEMTALYRTPNSLETYRMASFAADHPGFLEQHLRDQFGDDPEDPNFARFLQLASPDAPLGVSLSTNGRGALALRSRADDAWVVF